MLFDAIRFDGLERAVANVQCHLNVLDATRRERGQLAGREMQARGRGRNRPALTSVNRLVAILVRCLVLTLDVRRQRDVADTIDRIGKATGVIRRKSNRASPLEMHRHDFAVDTHAIPLEEHRRAGLQLLSGMNQRVPFRTVGIRDLGFGIWDLRQQETLERTPTWDAMTKKPRREDARIVQDDQIARDEITAEVCEHRVLNSVVTMEDEQPRAAALARRMLGD